MASEESYPRIHKKLLDILSREGRLTRQTLISRARTELDTEAAQGKTARQKRWTHPEKLVEIHLNGLITRRKIRRAGSSGFLEVSPKSLLQRVKSLIKRK